MGLFEDLLRKPSRDQLLDPGSLPPIGLAALLGGAALVGRKNPVAGGAIAGVTLGLGKRATKKRKEAAERDFWRSQGLDVPEGISPGTAVQGVNFQRQQKLDRRSEIDRIKANLATDARTDAFREALAPGSTAGATAFTERGVAPPERFLPMTDFQRQSLDVRRRANEIAASKVTDKSPSEMSTKDRNKFALDYVKTRFPDGAPDQETYDRTFQEGLSLVTPPSVDIPEDTEISIQDSLVDYDSREEMEADMQKLGVDPLAPENAAILDSKWPRKERQDIYRPPVPWWDDLMRSLNNRGIERGA